MGVDLVDLVDSGMACDLLLWILAYHVIDFGGFSGFGGIGGF